jgi:hypothetical protein
MRSTIDLIGDIQRSYKYIDELAHSHKTYIEKLRPDEKELLKKYTNGWDKDLCCSTGSSKKRSHIDLINGSITIKNARIMLKHIIEKAPRIKNSIVVFIGVPPKNSSIKIPKKNVISSSLDINIADHYASGMSLDLFGEISAVKLSRNASCLYIESLSEYSGEQEVLLDNRWFTNDGIQSIGALKYVYYIAPPSK